MILLVFSLCPLQNLGTEASVSLLVVLPLVFRKVFFDVVRELVLTDLPGG